jgi:hypothetical protein
MLRPGALNAMAPAAKLATVERAAAATAVACSMAIAEPPLLSAGSRVPAAARRAS